MLCAQLSVEVNGSLVGDSPYMVMFEVEDNTELAPEDEDGTARATQKVGHLLNFLGVLKHVSTSLT